MQTAENQCSRSTESPLELFLLVNAALTEPDRKDSTTRREAVQVCPGEVLGSYLLLY